MKLPILKFKKPSKIDVSLGLDIGHSYIKLVNLRKGSENVFLDDFCIQNISGNIPILLKKITTEYKFPTNRLNISLSGKSTIVRDLWMPKMNLNELKVSLGYELDQYVPFPVEDIYYDSYILEEGPLTRKEGQMRVVLAVAKKGVVNERIQWLKDAGFIPNIIDVDAISLFNVFQWSGQASGTVGLIDIGSSKTIINIVSDNVLTFTREIEYGTIRIREWVSHGLSIGMDEAEKLICAGDSRIEGWVQDLVSRLGKELWSSFEYYEGQEQRPVEKVYITGGGSLLPGLVGLLSQSVGLPVEIWHPLAKVKINLDDAKKLELQKKAPMFSIAIGLACMSL